MRRGSHNEKFVLKKISRSAGAAKQSPLIRSLLLGMGDDAALFKPKPGYDTILTCDWFLEGTHFLRDKHPPDSVGWKCLARAVSDVAAMGGIPRCFLLSLALPATLTGRWLELFLGGLRRASSRFRCILAGGDTTRRKDVLLNVTVVGEVSARHAVLRSGAQGGDLIYVSGRLGEAELGLQMLRGGTVPRAQRKRSLRKHLYPEPRLALGQWLAAKRLATSMMDLSDGLSTDLGRLCTASRVGALLDLDGFPAVEVPARLRTRIRHPLDLALNGGEDYELLFTAAPGKLPCRPWQFRGLPITPIGYITRGPQVVWKDAQTAKPQILRPGGWDPFRKSP
ncbi:MAG TPA: thiamine-phosphate kinase [Candidatus Acidoferrum sp.]|jgi:thiamine-monophosphate kinase|nr:thiamine-phosphate kinase [Candidatus Acidoferrum sp.]